MATHPAPSPDRTVTANPQVAPNSPPPDRGPTGRMPPIPRTVGAWLGRGAIALGLALGSGEVAWSAEGFSIAQGITQGITQAPIAQAPNQPPQETTASEGKSWLGGIPASYWGALTLGGIALIFLIPVAAMVWGNRPVENFPDIDGNLPHGHPKTTDPDRASSPATATQTPQFALLRIVLFAPPLPLPSPLADLILTADRSLNTLTIENPETIALSLLRLAPHWSHAKVTVEQRSGAEGLQAAQRLLLQEKAQGERGTAASGAIGTIGATKAIETEAIETEGYQVVTCLLQLQDPALNWSQPYEAEALTAIVEQLATLSPAQLQTLQVYVVPALGAGLSSDQLLVRYPDLVAL